MDLVDGKKGAIKLRNEYGQWRSGKGKADCIVELRDSLPHYMEDAPDDSPFGFSLHGHTDEIHNYLVRDPKNFDRVCATLKEAHERGIEHYFVNHVVHKKNFQHTNLASKRGAKRTSIGRSHGFIRS